MILDAVPLLLSMTATLLALASLYNFNCARKTTDGLQKQINNLVDALFTTKLAEDQKKKNENT